ncbi:MAG TPA: hypothetical protein VFA76_16680 [Terriglobales bacterium]|nr:hypothetical protein [Terriglobales bacterium]
MRLAVTGTVNAAIFDSYLLQCQPCIQGTDGELVLDLSSADWGYPSGLVPLASLMRALSGQGVTVRVDSYPDKSVCSYYCRMGFFNLIGANSPCRQVRGGTGEGRFIEITELRHPQIEAEKRTKLVGLLRRLPEGVNATGVSRSSFIDACGELVSNTRHAYEARIDNTIGTRPPALLQAQFYPKRGLVEFCVSDCGLGIKRSMEGEHGAQPFTSHLDAIDAALAFRNKNPMGGGEGIGLSALHSYIKKNGGTLRIRSGDALKVQQGDRRTTSTQQLPGWDGTIVTLEIRVEKAADLSRIVKRLAK